VDRDPEERRNDRSLSEGSPSEATNIREEPFPHEEERPRDHGLERSWWRRIFRGPHEQATQRPWWRRMFGG
jgi:hypothetical protein